MLWICAASSAAAQHDCGWFSDLNADWSADLAADSCGLTRTDQGALHYCFWVFPFRTPASFDRFNSELLRVSSCFPSADGPLTPNGVNHPDTHNVRIFQTNSARITVSLKDKSQLGKTLVFLQIEPEIAR